ncbi:MAG: S16 family serine protease [Fidelibacterota bacterium]
MTSLLEFERRFQVTMSGLSNESSSHAATSLILHLFSAFKDIPDPEVATSYFLEILPYITRHVSEETLAWRPPTDLQVMAEMWRRFHATGLISDEDFHSVDTALKRSQVMTSLQIRDSGLLVKHLKTDVPYTPETGDVPAILRELIDHLQDSKSQDLLRKTASDLEKLTTPIPGKYRVWTLLVENIRIGKGLSQSGFLSPLSVQLDPMTENATTDYITFNHQTVSGDLIYNQIENAYQWAKIYILGSRGAGNTFYHASYRFPEMEALYTGNSLGLAIGLVTLAALSNREGARFTYEVQPDVAITGALTVSGEVGAVEPGSLKQKLEVALLSHCSYIIVPQSNLADTEEALLTLRKTYPGSVLALIPVRSVREVLSDSRVIRKKRRRWLQRLATRRFRRQLTLVGTTGLLGLLGAIIVALSIDKNPAGAYINGSVLKIENARHGVLWKKDFDQFQYTGIKNGQLPIVDVADYDQDGENEVVYIANRGKKQNKDVIYYFESDGHEVWSYGERRTMIFGSESFKPPYLGKFLIPYSGNGRRTFFTVLSQSPFYPDVFYQFDNQGQILQEFWNPGELKFALFHDFEEDDEEELLVGGGSNDFNSAMLYIFTPGLVSGCGPVDNPAYQVQNVPPGRFKYGIRFNPLPTEQIDYSREEIFLINIDDNGKYKLNINSIYGPYIIRMNSPFEVDTVIISDTFLANYSLKHHSEFLSEFSPDTIFKTASAMRFWDGEKWSDEPVINKYWYNDEITETKITTMEPKPTG